VEIPSALTGAHAHKDFAMAISDKLISNMHNRSRLIVLHILALLFAFSHSLTFAEAQTNLTPALSANDVSWLFPAPQGAADLAKLISIKDLTSVNSQDTSKRDPIWSPSAFQQFLDIAASPAALVAGTTKRIGLPGEVKVIDAWHIAGVRIDPGAPGVTPDVVQQFGQRPQIRLILQPLTRDQSGALTVHDIAAHLIFDFITGVDAPAEPGCFPRAKPDVAKFKQIVADLAALRSKLADGSLGANRVATAGRPLGIHPGLADATTAQKMRQEIKMFLERHLSADRLGSMAVMGLPSGAPSPWIFLSMLHIPAGVAPQLPNGGFIPVHGPALDGQQFAEMLNGVGTSPRVVPTPHTNNLQSVTCKNGALTTPAPPIADRRGSSTSELFSSPPPPRDKIKSVLDLIADPGRSHFFNTDCVSCHTDTRLSMELLQVTDVTGIDRNLLPNGPWNVRNFGWSPPIEGPTQGTVTRRTETETATVIKFINEEILNK
jgi:hypothetical protein